MKKKNDCWDKEKWWETHFIVDGLPKEVAKQLKDKLKEKLKQLKPPKK